MVKPQELRALSEKDLRVELEKAHQALFNLRFRVATRQLSNYRALRQARRDVARVKTVLREQELAGQMGGHA